MHTEKRCFVKPLLLLACCLFMYSAKALDAQPRSMAGTEAADPLALFALPLSQLLDLEVEVANKILTPLSKAPSSVTVYTGPEIARMGVSTVSDLLNYVPSVTVSRSSGEGRSEAISVRGRKSNSVGREVLVLLDGLRLNDPVTGGVFAQDRAINIEMIERVEVVRGPGSAIYGANAYSSVINLVTKHSVSEAQVTLGRHDHLEGSVAIAAEEDNIGASLFVSHVKDNGDYYDPFFSYFGVSEATRDPYRQSDIYFRAWVKELTLYLRRNERSDSEFVADGAGFSSRQRHRVENRSARITYQADHDFGETMVFVEQTENDADSLFVLFPEDPNPPLAGNPFYWSDGSTEEMLGGNFRTVEQFRVGFEGVSSISHRHTLNYGAEYRKEEVGLNPFQSSIDIETLRLTDQIIPSSQPGGIEAGFYLPGGVRADFLTPSDRESVGVYLQDQWQISDAIALTLGARHDHYQDFSGHTSYRVAGVWGADDSHTFKALYGNSFRAPSFSETRAGIATGGISNPDLKPEELQTFELNWSWSGRRLSSSATVYFNQYNDLILPVLVSDVVPGFTAFQPQNVGKDIARGVEYELLASLGGGSTARFGGSHMFETLENQPVGKRQYYFTGRYRSQRFVYSADAFYHPATPAVVAGHERLPSFWVANVGAAYVVDKFELSASVRNLFDRSYSTWGPQAQLVRGLPGRGREIFGSVKVKL